MQRPSPARQARRLLATLAAVVAALAATSTASADVVFQGNPNTGPPATLGPYTLTQFPDDPRPQGEVVNVPSPLGGDVLFAPAMLHYADAWGSAWATGAPRYTYFSNGSPTGTLTLPAGTGAFNFYMEPDDFGTRSFEAVAQDGTSSGPVEISAAAGGGRHFGFYATGGDTIAEIVIRNLVASGRNGFGIGAFGIAAALPGEQQPEFLQCYDVQPAEDEDRTVAITDQFGSKTVSIGQALRLCTPTDVDGAVGEGFDLEAPHYVCYSVSRGLQANALATVTNRFDTDELEVERGKQLCVVSGKALGGGEAVTAAAVDEGFVDRYQCYDLDDSDDIVTTVSARDQFGTFRLRARRMMELCAPAGRDGEGAPAFDGPHYACYQTDRDHHAKRTVTVTNEFGSEELFVQRSRRLCAASEKTLAGGGV